MFAWWVALAQASPVKVEGAEAAQLAAACGTEHQVAASQAFRLQEAGRPWHGEALVPSLDTTELCLVQAPPAGQARVIRVTLLTCMNCSLDEVAAVGFPDLNGDSVPDLTLALRGTTGWDPQATEGRLVQGTVFVAFQRSADGLSLTELPAAREVDGASLADLHRALSAAARPKAPAPRLRPATGPADLR